MKQANVKMLSSALAPCVFFVFNQALGVCFYKQVEPHITCPTMVFDLILFFLITQLESPDLIYECTHLLSLFFSLICRMLSVYNVNSGQDCQIHVEFNLCQYQISAIVR